MGNGTFNSKTAIFDGIRFDSIAEKNRYVILKMMQQSGLITDLKVHPRFTLLNSMTIDGVRQNKIEYEADFSYFDLEKGVPTVEDVKGFHWNTSKKMPAWEPRTTSLFLAKMKLFKAKFPDKKFLITEG